MGSTKAIRSTGSTESCLLIVVGWMVCGYGCGMQTSQVVNTRRMCLCWSSIRERTQFLPIIDELVDDRLQTGNINFLVHILSWNYSYIHDSSWLVVCASPCWRELCLWLECTSPPRSENSRVLTVHDRWWHDGQNGSNLLCQCVSHLDRLGVGVVKLFGRRFPRCPRRKEGMTHVSAHTWYSYTFKHCVYQSTYWFLNVL